MDYDFLDKFIDDCGGEFLYPHILADNCGEAVKVALVLFVGIDFLLVCLDLFFQFPLFRFILCGQLQKSVMADCAAYVVLINPLEDTVKFRYPLPCLSDFTLPALHFLFCFSGALLIHHFMESHDVIKEKGGHVKYPAPYDLLQHFLADKVRRTASRITLIICTAVMVL